VKKCSLPDLVEKLLKTFVGKPMNRILL
jgi:hypothetical protein